MGKTSGGTVTKTTVYYPGGAMRVNGTLYFVLKDKLGSASVVTDSTGAIVGEQRYYPFGETRVTTGTIYTDKLFTGQREMAGLGIYHYGARFFSPKIGRFLSADTIVPNPANPQDFNRYSYVRNNPLRYTDPTGHAAYSETEAGCSGGGPACIMDMWSGYDDADHMMAALRNWVRYHKDYNLQADSRLSDEEKVVVATATFQAAVEDKAPAAEVAAAGSLLSFFSIIVNGVNMSPDDRGGGGGGSIIHNHHMLPQQFRAKFKQAGLNIEDYTVDLPSNFHYDIHGRGGGEKWRNSWNQQWLHFFDQNRNPSRDQILNQLQKMKQEFGIP